MVKGLLTFFVLLSVPVKISAALGLDKGETIDHLLEKADSLSDVDGERALALTTQILTSLGEREDSISAEVNLIRGNACFSLGRYDEARIYLGRAMEIASALDNPFQMARIHSGQGVICRILGELESALGHYQKALQQLKRCDAPDEEANVLISLSILYNHIDRYVDSENFARQAYEMAQSCKDTPTLIYILNNYGMILYQNGKTREGVNLMQKSLNLAEKQVNVKYILKVYTSMMGFFYMEQEADSVDHYMRKGKSLITQVPEGSVEAVGFLQQSAIILSEYGRYEMSNDLWLKMLDLPTGSRFVSEHKVCQLMARNYKELHDYNRMEKMYERAITLIDSLRSSTIDRQMSDFNVKYGTAQKELKIAKMEAEKAHSRFALTLFISILVIGFIIAVSLFYVRDKQRRRSEELQRIRERLEGIEQERARLAKDLHDGVCNDLLGVGYMLQMNDCGKEEIFNLINNIRDDVRTMSHNLLPPKFHSLNLDQLFRGMAQKTVNFIQYRSEHDEPWEILSEDVAYQLYRIVQELISNVRKHTTAESMQMDMALHHKGLRLELSHTGKNKDEASSQTKGIGLETTRRRLMLIGATMTHNDKEEHKEVIIALNLQ